MNDLPDTVILSGSDVLADHRAGACRNAVGKYRDQFLDLVADGVGGGSHKTIGVDMSGTDELCEVDEDGLCCQGDAESQQYLEMLHVDLQGTQSELQFKYILLAPQEDRCCRKGGDLGCDCCNGSACGFPGDYHNEQDVHDDIGCGSDCHKDQRFLCLTHASENAGCSIVSEDKGQTKRNDDMVCPCLFKGFRRAFQPCQ